ncbi:MAG: lysozyme inhibitor LprI family protein, partial [Gammaproteobacteria bacterium]
MTSIRKHPWTSPATLTLAMLLPLIAAAASFDCSRTATVIERMICASPRSSGLDETLANVYQQALATASDKQALEASQREWLKNRRDACRTEDCLINAYYARLAELRARTTRPVQLAGRFFSCGRPDG